VENIQAMRFVIRIQAGREWIDHGFNQALSDAND
jgi:hypothetical protein